jgi:hypothetical protein
LFVVGGGIWEGLRVGLIGERTMGESPGKKIRLVKNMFEQERRRGTLPRWFRLFARQPGLFVPCGHGPL